MALVWITGLSGSGKTTLAKALKKNMLGEGDNPILMDGDVLREVRLYGKRIRSSR